MLRTIVIPRHGLHSLVQTHYYHRKNKRQTVDHTIRRNSHITSEILELVIDNNHYKAMGDII